jgi:tRNA(fMet)-specific endonuclease VapC
MAATIGYLLDTNILVQLIRGNRLGQEIDSRYAIRTALNRSMVSIVTVGEILSFALKLGWGKPKVDQLARLLSELVWIDINRQEVLDAYAELDQFSESNGNTMGKNDIWIAATAKATGAILLTTDKDFDHLAATHIQRVWIDPQIGRAA